MSRIPCEKRTDLAVVVLAAGLAVALAAVLAGRPGAPLLLFPPCPWASWPLSWIDRALMRALPPGAPSAVFAFLASGALWWRRRWPAAVTLLLLVLGLVTPAVTAPALAALFTVAALRPVRVTAWVSVLAALPVPLYVLTAHGAYVRFAVLACVLIAWALVAGAVGWGLFVRSRRVAIASLTERARHAEEEAAWNAREARQRAREEVAREMHDVLAHRLSLLSVQAGGLEFNPGSAPEKIEQAAGAIRSNAHAALQDLRMVIGVLRTPAAGEPGLPFAHSKEAGPAGPRAQQAAGAGVVERPQPVLADLPRLAEESRAAGMDLTLHQAVTGLREVPGLAGRTAYRIVQEGLTNARKHAPGAAVHVEVTADPDTGIDIIVRNTAPTARQTGQPVPGSGHGLAGLAERAALAGGEIRHSPAGDGYLLQGWLPWST